MDDQAAKENFYFGGSFSQRFCTFPHVPQSAFLAKPIQFLLSKPRYKKLSPFLFLFLFASMKFFHGGIMPMDHLDRHDCLNNAASPQQGASSPDSGGRSAAPCGVQNGHEQDRPIRILRLPEVIARVGLRRASIYLHIANGTFPKQIALGVRAVGWLESEIEGWIVARIRGRG